MSINPSMKVTEVFNQTGQMEYGIPDHWCVQYYLPESGFPMYEYCETYQECVIWIKENCLKENNYADMQKL